MPHLRHATLALIALCITPPALADDGPLINRRPGLWQSTIDGPTPTVLRECTDHANDAALWNARNARPRPGCTPTDLQRTPVGGTSRMVCRTPAGAITTDAEMTRTDDPAHEEAETYRLTTHVSIDPPPAQLANGITVTMNARWLGPCPAAMQPGDTIDAAGRKLPRPPN